MPILNENSLTTVITALHETWSLKETVDRIVEQNPSYLHEILIVIASHSSPECRAVIASLKSRYGSLVREHQQTLPYVGGAIIDAIGLVKSKYTVMLAADLETDPSLIPKMYNEILTRDLDVVSTSRWLNPNSFHGYSPIKLLLNNIFQRVFSSLYTTNLTDMTYGYRMYKTELLQKLEFCEHRHAFFFESLIKPLRLGAKIEEISAPWHARQEGESVLRLSDYLKYFQTGFTVRFRPPQRCLKETPSIHDSSAD